MSSTRTPHPPTVKTNTQAAHTLPTHQQRAFDRSPGQHRQQPVKGPRGQDDRPPIDVAQLVKKLFGEDYVTGLTDEVVSQLKSDDSTTVFGALSGLKGVMTFIGSAPKQPIKEADMKLCASEIAALNRPKTLDEILDSYLFSHARDLAKHTYLPEAVNAPLGPATLQFMTLKTKIEGTRIACVTAVVGPSGAGKTTYSMKVVSQKLQETLQGTSIAARPTTFTYHTNFLNDQSPCADDVYADVRKLCKDNGIAVPDGSAFLGDMYLHVIVDECDRFPSMTDAAFLSWRTSRIDHFLNNGFGGVHITLVGTLLDVRMAAVGSQSAGFAKIRLQPWTKDNFEVFVCGTVKDAEKKTVSTFVEASPLLMSLTTNARAAVFLVDAIVDRMDGSGSVLGSTGAILDHVVLRYLKSNGLYNHTAEQMACVGLSALRCALGLHINAKKLAHIPSAIEEHCIRRGLLTWNVELVKGKDQTIPDSVKYVNGGSRIGMQPALVLVCLAMCGLLSSSRQIEGWSGVELIAALWAACSIPFNAEENGDIKHLEYGKLRALGNSKQCTIHFSAHAFGHSPKDKTVQLVDNARKNLSVSQPGLLFANILPEDVPTTAVINADKGHGMDVVAPWLLIQAKHNMSPNSPYNVNVMEELQKAGLFANSRLTPLTKALVLAWEKVPSSTPPAVLSPLSHLLEYIPKEKWDKTIAVVGGNLERCEIVANGTNNGSTSKSSSKRCVITQITVAPVPKGSVRVVLLLFGHSFLLKTSSGGPSGNNKAKNSPQLRVNGDGGCVRLLTVANKKVKINKGAVPTQDKDAQDALRTLSTAVYNSSPDVDFVLDIVYQPLK